MTIDRIKKLLTKENCQLKKKCRENWIGVNDGGVFCW